MKNRVPALGAVFVPGITGGILGLTVCWRRGLAALSVVAAVLLVLGQPAPSLAGGQPPVAASATAGPFNKVWTYALSQYAQASQTGQSLAQLSDGTVVVGGNDAYQPNYCFKPNHPFRGIILLGVVRGWSRSPPGAAATSGSSSTRRVPARRSRRAPSAAPRTAGSFWPAVTLTIRPAVAAVGGSPSSAARDRFFGSMT
jgi:hypothetical protein